MLTRQALAVTAAVGRALRHPIDPNRAAEARRRRAPLAPSATALAEHVIEVGREHHLTYLRRRGGWRELESLLRGGTLPVVLVVGTRPDFTVLVIDRLEGEAVAGVQVDAEAQESVIGSLSFAALEARLAGQVVDLLVPVAVAPVVSDEAEVAAGTVDHEHPRPWPRLMQLLGHEKRLVTFVYLYAALAGLFSLALPLGVQAIIGLVAGGMLIQPVILLIAFVIAGTLANGGLQIMQLSVVETVQQRVFARYAFEIGARMSRLRLDSVGEVDLPELMNRFFEIKMIQKALSKILTDWVAALLQVLFGVILLTFYHPLFALLGLLLVGTLGAIFRWSGPRGLETSLQESGYKYRVAHWLQELSRHLVAFKFAGRGELPIERLDREVTGYLAYRQAHFRVLVQQSWAFVVFKTIISGGILILGCVLVVNRSITLGQFVASELVIVSVLLAVEKAILGLADFYDLLTAVEKAGHITDLPLEKGSGLVPPPVAESNGLRLELRGLSFTYEGAEAPVLRDVTLVAQPGEHVAVTGVQGAGESTLLSVIGGIFESYTGAITYDHVSLREMDRARARELVAHATTDVALFEGTIEENVAMGRSWVRTEDVLEAVATVGLLEWLQAQPEGLQTPIQSMGRGLPTQAARKVELARALAGRPRLLLLDDVLDVLDPRVKRDLLARLLRPGTPWTVVAVTHDTEVMAACDRVVVLRDGAVACDGPFATLRQDDPYFRQLLVK